MLRSADVGRAQAVSRPSLRHRASRSARGSHRSAVRRDRAGGTRSLPRAQPVQRRPPDAAGLRGGGRAQLSRLARPGRSHGGGARVLGAVAGLRRPRRRGAHENGPRRVASPRAIRNGLDPASRAHASRAEGRAAAASSRDARRARADLPPLRGRRAVRRSRRLARHRGRRRSPLAPGGRLTR